MAIRRSRSRASLAEWLQAGLLAANLVWTTLCLGGYLPKTLVITSLLTAAMVVVHLVDQGWAARARRVHPAGWWFLPFLLYGLANVLWVTPVAWLGWRDWFWWLQMIAVFWVVLNGIHARGPRALLLSTLIAVALVSVGLACYQRFVNPRWLMLGREQAEQFMGRASGSFGVPNSLAALIELVLPACGALVFRRRADITLRILFAWITGVLLLGFILTISRGGWIALVLALSLWPLFHTSWPWRRRLLVASGALAGLLVVAGLTFASPKVRERFLSLREDAGERTRPIMWRAAWRIFQEQPVFGSGAGSYNTAFEKHRPETERREPVWTHNDYLNTLSDYGLVGFLLFFGPAAGIAVQARRQQARRDRERQRPVDGPEGSAAPPGSAVSRPGFVDGPDVQAALGVGLLSFALHLFVDFHFKLPALAMAFATVAALVLSRAWPARAAAESAPATPSAARRIGFSLAGGAVAALAVLVMHPWQRAEGMRWESRRDLDRLVLRPVTPAEKRAIAQQAYEVFTDALTLWPSNPQAWADRAYAAAILANVDSSRERELGRRAEEDARRALAITEAVPEFWIRLGVALDMQSRWNDAGNAFAHALSLAPLSATCWFHHAYHLALNPVSLPLARAAVATCLRLDPTRAEAESLRRHLATGQ